jgi:hypothetical protein
MHFIITIANVSNEIIKIFDLRGPLMMHGSNNGIWHKEVFYGVSVTTNFVEGQFPIKFSLICTESENA